jgi:hypothetical protein
MQTNTKKLLEVAGIEEVRPTDEALAKMGMSRRRWTQLLENININPMTVQELEAIKEWIQGLQNIDTDKLIGKIPDKSQLSERLGLSK